jgi:carbonic anhydrase/acetyltransferase-like protein (isoleucine patch superfamily)
VELAAVVMVPPSEDSAAVSAPFRSSADDRTEGLRRFGSLLTPIVGNDILHAWIERIRKLGVPSLWLSSSQDEELACSTLQAFASQGVQRFLTIKLKSYAEMDLSDLVHFHCESRSTVTEVHDSRGRLGVRVFDHPAPAGGKCEYCIPTQNGHASYPFHGYAKRLLTARERQDLVGDVLTGGCAMRPLGREIREQVWIAEGARVADSVRIVGPSYIGANTEIRAGATIGPFAAVERDCVVDYGTTVERSTVLPGTYLAAGLLIRNALVDGRYLENVTSGSVVDLQPAGLANKNVAFNPDAKEATRQETGYSAIEARASDVSSAAAAWRRVQL